MSRVTIEPPSLCAIRIPNGQTLREAKRVEIIDQLELPHAENWISVSTVEEAFDAIKSMKIRGAPAIASLAALSIACALLSLPSSASETSSVSSFQNYISNVSSYLLASRPTAVNLQEALSRIAAVSTAEKSVSELVEDVIEVCITVWEEDLERCWKMGEVGGTWLLEKLESEGRIEKGDKIAVLTVCNTGSLATSGYGTALGLITYLHSISRLSVAYYMATSPYYQGARLTSMELKSLGVPSMMICDTAVGALLATKQVHAFVAGADRIVANGDTANKISTCQIANLCQHPLHPSRPKVPVLISAPLTTVDLSLPSGDHIKIEDRPSKEAITVRGKTDITNGLVTVQFAPDGIEVWNPAFDVTPARLIDAIVTEVGVAVKKDGEEQFGLKEWVEERKRDT
ncbi:putative translation initiation factor [Atractiella rhizophila]|nr:putative translation initiation factor [Atractiella rhizophila]